MLVQEPIHAAIWHCLNHYAYEDAVFLAERLYTEVGTDESLFLLATCYYRKGQLHQAYDILRKNESSLPKNRFLLAKCCIELEKIHEAELALVNDVLDINQRDVCEDVVTNFQDIACFALQTLASVFVKTERSSRANEADRRALKLNPLLWHSFEKLCQRGDFPNPESVFASEKLEDMDHCCGSNHVIKFANKICQKDVQTAPTSNNQPPKPSLQPSLLTTPHFSKRASSTSTPILPISSLQMLEPNNAQLPQPVIFVTPINEQEVTGDAFDTPDFASPAAAIPNFQLTLSGVGLLSDTEKSSVMDTSGRVAMPPPVKPKPMRRMRTERKFGRFPHGALVWSSGGKAENVLPTNSLVGSRLEFSPLGVLSPHINPSTSFGNVQTPKIGSQGSSDQSQTSSVPLINATNSDHKLKRSSNENSTPLKQSLFGQSSQNQNTPANNHVSGNVRRSSRLFGSSQQQSIKAKENAKTPANSISPKGARSFKSPSKKSSKSSRPHSRHSSTPSSGDNSLAEMNEKNRLIHSDTMENQEAVAQWSDSKAKEHALSLQKHSLDGLMGLFRQLGDAYLALARFQCQDAITAFESIDSHHLNTAWVMGSIGKTYFEKGDYAKARSYFQRMRDFDPYRNEFTEYYSTTLWHLQEEVDLSALAQELTSANKMSAQAWCAAGNCFSLQKEHENAIKFFQRASQVDPSFAYAYTLLGHEYITIEELDKALSCFRSAVRIDPRHYNAWYGIGLVFYKQERFQLSEIYYKKTVDINPQSPVLMCHLAVVQHALQKTDKALETLNVALSKAPQNPLCKFEKASILFSIERFDEALVELNELKVLVPKESPVFFLMGKVHNKLNNTHMALMHFSWAMDLDPKGANSQIKDALDRSMNKAAQENVDTLGTTSGNVNLLDDDDEDEDEEEEEMMQDIPSIV